MTMSCYDEYNYHQEDVISEVVSTRLWSDNDDDHKSQQQDVSDLEDAVICKSQKESDAGYGSEEGSFRDEDQMCEFSDDLTDILDTESPFSCDEEFTIDTLFTTRLTDSLNQLVDDSLKINDQVSSLKILTDQNMVHDVSPGVFETSLWPSFENDLMNRSSLYEDSFGYPEEELETPLNLSLLVFTNELTQLDKLETSLSTLFYQTISNDHFVAEFVYSEDGSESEIQEQQNNSTTVPQDSVEMICETDEEIKPEPATCVQHELSQTPCDTSSDKLRLCEKRSQATTKLLATRRARNGIKRRVTECFKNVQTFMRNALHRINS